MRVLTVRQPWAWAIIHGCKDVENRSRNIAGEYRGPVAIHAGLAKFERGTLAGAALRELYGSETPTQIVFGGIIGVVELTGAHFGSDDDACSRWGHPLDWHLDLSNPRPLRTPIPFKGALGLRRLDADTIAAITEQLP